MSEGMLWLVCTVGLIVLAIVITLLANLFNRLWIRKRSRRMQEDIRNGTYDPKKKYFGNQGGWEPDEYTDTTNHPPL